MALRRLLLAVATFAALGAAFAGRAGAALPPCAPAQPQTLASDHFILHYDGVTSAADYLTETQAGDLAGKAEAARTAYLTLGYPAPLTTGSGKTEIYVYDLSSWGLSSYGCAGSVTFDVTEAKGDSSALEIGFAVFAQIAAQLYTPAAGDYWLVQGASQWAAAKATGYPAVALAHLGPPDMSLDCWDTVADSSKCSSDAYENLGLSRWPFYEYLFERFGDGFIQEMLTDAQTAGSAFTGLSNAIAAHGSTFTDVFNGWSALQMTGGYSISALQGQTPTTYTTLQAGTHAGTVATIHVPVDHLAGRIVEIDRGDGTTTGACYAATLSITVTIPAGTSSVPAYYWATLGSSATTLSVSGATATASVPWDTCTWSSAKGYLVLPNASTSLNSADFTVSVTMTVDSNTPVSQFDTPGLVSTNTPVTSLSGGEIVPAIDVFGPEVMTVETGDSQLRVVVQANAQGQFQALLGSFSLGTVWLRAGANDIRFTLPATLLATLQQAGTAGLPLALTPLSASGALRGAAVTRTVRLDEADSALAAKHAKAQAKAKAKARARRPEAKANARARARAKAAKRARAHK